MTFTPLEVPALAATAQSADAALAVAPGSGEVLLGWVGGDGETWTLFVARSSDGARTWSPAAAVAGGPAARGEVRPHGESAPRLVAGPDGRVAVAWPNSIPVPGRKWPAAMMRFARSGDGGRTWSPPVTLNDDTTGTPASHQFHGAAWTGDSGLVVAWLDERGTPPAASPASPAPAQPARPASPMRAASPARPAPPAPPTAPVPGANRHQGNHTVAEGDATVYLASSADFGRTWGPNRPAWGAVCPCCRISLARGTDGAAIAAWRQHFPGDVRDVVTAPLTPNPGDPARVHADNWVYPGCPHTGPALAVGTDGATHVVWYTGKPDGAGVFYARRGGDSVGPVALVSGKTLPSAHPSVVVLPDGGALAAYDLSPDGTRVITLARLSSRGELIAKARVPGSEEGKYPQLAVLPDSTAIVAWTTTNGGTSRVRLASVTFRR